MASPITQIKISTTNDEEQHLREEGFHFINVNLNSGTNGNKVLLWYKKGSGAAITRIQFSYDEEMEAALRSTGFTKIPGNLNQGTNGACIIMWSYNGERTKYDIPVVDLSVTTNATEEAGQFQFGWERLPCDLNLHNSGDWVHVWVKRQKTTYICDVAASKSSTDDQNLFTSGYIRMDVRVNLRSRGDLITLWYRQCTDDKKPEPVTNLAVSVNHNEDEQLQQRGFTVVNVDLNQGSQTDTPVFLWYKKSTESSALKIFTVSTNPKVYDNFLTAGLQCVSDTLNSGRYWCMWPLHMWFK